MDSEKERFIERLFKNEHAHCEAGLGIGVHQEDFIALLREAHAEI